MKTKVYLSRQYFAQEKEIINRQISVLREFANKLDKNIFDYAIDKDGHLVLFSHYKDENTGMQSIFADFLGLDKEEHISLISIGKIDFDEKDKYIEITKLGVEEDYSGLNIGKMLMQVVENIAYDKKKDKIFVGSKLNKTRLNGTLPCKQDFASLDEYSQAIKQDMKSPNLKLFFDKNLYFYTCLGYKKTKTLPDVSKDAGTLKYIPMVKTHLKNVKLSEGYYLKEEIKRTNRKFSIKKRHIEKNACEYYPIFEMQGEDVQKRPICLLPTYTAIDSINHLLIKNVLELRKTENFEVNEKQD